MASGQANAQESAPIAILGAGSLGQLWAGYLPAGQCIFLERMSSRAVSTRSEPAFLEYRLKQPEGKFTQRRVAIASLAGTRPALVLVTTKTFDTLDALAQLMPQLAETVPVVLFQNGMGCQQAVADRWPLRPVIAASTTEGANRPDPATLVHAGRGQTWIGGLTESGTGCLEATVRQLSLSGLVVHAETDIYQRLWEKLAVNAGINAFTAILDCPNGEILAHPFFLEHIDSLAGEISAVMAHEASLALSTDDIKARIYAVATETATNTSSMRGDRQRGRETEVDSINGYIASKGRAAGVATPVNQMLTRRVKELT